MEKENKKIKKNKNCLICTKNNKNKIQSYCFINNMKKIKCDG